MLWVRGDDLGPYKKLLKNEKNEINVKKKSIIINWDELLMSEWFLWVKKMQMNISYIPILHFIPFLKFYLIQHMAPEK